MSGKYYFELDSKFTLIVKECIEELIKLKVPISNSIYFAFNGGYSYYGRTRINPRSKKCKGYEFYVTVNRFLISENDIKNTIVHELLHTVYKGMNHHGSWRKWMNFVNANSEYKITVYSKSNLQKEAYKRKKVFSEKDYDPQVMDIAECPVCKKRVCFRKGVFLNNQGKKRYLCAKCRKPFRIINL